MLRAIGFGLVGYFLGEREGERRAMEATSSQRSGASGWLGAFLILIAILAWGHVDLRPHSANVARPATVSTHAFDLDRGHLSSAR